ncbi:DgyrCDS14684 [Dimorphilus gyrociliatus]|uniref:DgyrCDS14684 n=1 Tax=Dimorphilus gyrociliatus TaxID=2664684 RepID=A0A7I8WEU3_9ANNE|nr:DgyrCDS14684 [Dimorphilus gyrociliatus]
MIKKMRKILIQTLFIIFIWFEIIIQVSLLNLARGKLSFQSSTSGSINTHSAPQYANDDNHEHCSSTDSDIADFSWWSVDLEQEYDITKVCLLNVNDNVYNNLKEFNIFVGNYPNDEKIVCRYVDETVQRPNSNLVSQYNCYTCVTKAIGSFVTIKLTTINIKLILCDVDVKGMLIDDKRGFELLNLNKLITMTGGQHKSWSKEKGYDNSYKTLFHSRSYFSTPYFLIDAVQTLNVHRIIIVSLYNDDYHKRFEKTYISIKGIPATDLNFNSRFCVENLSGHFRTTYELFNIECNPILTGRYIIINQNVGTKENRFLEFMEMYIYISNIDENHPKEFGHVSKPSIIDAKLNSVALSSNQLTLLQDNIYYINDNTGKIDLVTNDNLLLTTKLTHLNQICLTVFHASSFTPGIEIKIRNFLNNEIIERETNGNFKHSHTICVKTPFLLTKDIEILSKNNQGLAEVDLIALSDSPKCLQRNDEWAFPNSSLPVNNEQYLHFLLKVANENEEITIYGSTTTVRQKKTASDLYLGGSPLRVGLMEKVRYS